MTADAGRLGVFDRLPADAPLVASYAVLAGGAIALGLVDGPARVLLAAPLVGFLPGYALLSMLFPADRPPEADRPGTWRLPAGDGLGWVERCSMSVAASVALVAILAVVLGGVGVGFSTVTTTATVTAVVLGATAAGASRRLRLAPKVGYDVPVVRWTTELRNSWGQASRGDRLLHAAVAVVALLAVSGLAVGLAAPNDGESYTEAALLTPSEDGPVAAGYPDAVASEEPLDLVLTVENNLGRATEYEYVVVLDRVSTSADGADVRILERNVLTRDTVALGDGDTATRTLSSVPSMLGRDLRLSVFVYEDAAPESPSSTTADEHLYIWIDVEYRE